MNIALLNERVMFQMTSVSVDKYGNHINGWIDQFECYATVGTGISGTQSGDESSNEGGVMEQPTISVTVRYSPQAALVKSTTHRLVFHGDVYNILGVDYLNFRRNAIKFQCRRERA